MGVLIYGVLMKLICGIGVNDSETSVSCVIDGKLVMVAPYAAWRTMIQRCYSLWYQKRNPTYVGVSVCDEWRSFSAFKSWFDLHYVDGWDLDKDLLSSSRIYSPEACIYVPHWLNVFTTNSASTRGDLPLGVSYSEICGKFVSRCRHPMGKREHLGHFASKNSAHEAWKARKLEIAEELKGEMDDIDARIYPRVVEIIQAAK